ncbi:MAG: hypothetical protein IJF31_03860, partial [Clostridia bacterium]|nr:hypothetical protein [Clostridia bacterium]
DEPPKILVTRMEELLPNGVAQTSQPQQQAHAQEGVVLPDAATLARVRTLYLRVPSLQAPACTQVMHLLASARGKTPVSVFDASTKVYHKQQEGFDLTPERFGALCRLLGADNVVPK